MKRKILFLILLCIILVSCNNTTKPTEVWSKTSVPTYYNWDCSYFDGKNDEYPANFVFEDKSTIEILGIRRDDTNTSMPFFHAGVYISPDSKATLLPSFYIAGDRMIYIFYNNGSVNEKGTVKQQLLAPGDWGIITICDSVIKEYIRAKVSKIEESKIVRDEAGKIKEITGIELKKYSSSIDLSHITIDKEYHFIDITDYDGEKIYASYNQSGSIVRLYSFNPLE